MKITDIIEEYTANMKGIEAVDTANLIRLSCSWKEEDTQKSMKNLEEIINQATDLFNYLLKQKVVTVKGDMDEEN